MAGGAIDYYQHPTSANVLQFGLGQSVIRYSGNHWTVGFSTENIWVGPSRFFPVLFSNQSEGFPHFDIGTLGYVPVRIKKTELGLIDARAVLGYTRESDYYDDDSSNDFTQNILFSLGYALPKLKGLKLGFNYLMKKNMPNFTSNIWQLFDPSYAIFSRNTREATDGMISLTASWRFPKVGLEIYSEYARNDFTVTIGTYQISRIDHAKGYTIGLEKVFKLKTGKLFGVVLEFSDLMTVPYTNRANEPIWYKHFSVPQGHTHRGQLLGSPIGPASDSQILAMALYDTRVAWEWWIQRISVDNDYVYELSIMDEPYNRDYNYAILVAGIRWTQFNRFFDWYLEATGSLHLNYGYERDNDLGNIYLGAGLSY